MEKKIYKILKKVKIDDLLLQNSKGNLIDLNAVSKLIIKESSVTFVIDIGVLGIEIEKGKILQQRCKDSIISGTKFKTVNIILTSDKSSIDVNKNDNSEQEKNYTDKIPGVKKVIAVASGKGGVGKSTIAVNLAICLNRIGFKVGLIDADIYGPSIPHMMNLKGKPRLEGNFMLPANSYGVDCMSIGLLVPKEQSLVWRGPMVTKTLHQLIRGTKWQDIDYLIVDLPPGTGDVHLSIAQKFPLDGVAIVSTPGDVATIDTVKSIDMFKKLEVPILGVIQNMAYLVDDNGKKNYIFGQDGAKNMAEKMEVNFLGDIALDTKIREAGDNKNPISNLSPSSDIAFNYGRIVENILEKISTEPR